MQQIADWLKKLGMSEYAERFAENAIDFSVLPDLTDQDLEKLGVLLGHRRKLLRAIAELGATPATTAMAPALVAPAQALTAAPATSAQLATLEAVGERRYLTVIFCDLVGSTSIAAQLDAEEWRDLVGSYLNAASTAVTEMGGHVAKKLGDGLMCLFGYPVAQENDAERAARAALGIQRALAELNRKNSGSGKPELVARIGLESGPVVVDSAGEIFGDAPNIAARVQASAEPGAILITARVQRQIAGLFVAEERGSHALKGVSERTVLFRLVRASGGGRRSGARHLTPLVGRDEEMAMLMRRWDRARTGDGQLVLIVGEPGLGKSRLIEEFHIRLKDIPHTWSEWSCSQLLQNTPLHPITEWGRQRFGGPDVSGERRLADLESTLAQVKLDPAENIPLLAPLLDIPLPKERAPTLAPEELRRRQLAALTNWVIAGAKNQPLVLAFEDLHWADPTTLDVLRSVAERGALAPLFIIATARPEFRPPWSMRSHHGTISLAPLDRSQVRDMVAELSARHALPGSVVDDVAARTGGVPLFVEEVTRLLLERGDQDAIQSIPPTLQQSLMARLDRLGSAREVAQIGSVIGRGFSYRLLREVAGMEDAALQAALERLAEADIVFVQGLPPDADYRFKHALIQDAAYENLLKSRRQMLHRRVAEILRDRFAATADAEPEVLARHFTQASLTDAAIEWWGKAGDQALRRSAFQEAISHLGKAIEMADKSDESVPRSEPASVGQRLKLQTSYGRAVMFSHGYAATETKAAFTRAENLVKGTEDAVERFNTYHGLWAGSLLRGELKQARETAEIFLHEAEKEARILETVIGHRLLGVTRLSEGDLTQAQEHLASARKLYDPKRDREAKFHFGVDSNVGATAFLARSSWLLGDINRARVLIDEAVAHAVETAHATSLAYCYKHKATLETIRGDAAATREIAETIIGIGREHGLALYLAWGSVYLGWAIARLGDRETGITELRKAVAAYAEQGNKLYLPLFQALLAEIEAEGGDTKEALSRIDEALALAAETGEHWTDAFLHRIRGEILLKRDPANTAPAEEAFLTAIAVAQQQEARTFELRAALVLAKLYQSTGRTADAHAVLTPAIEGFSPTPEFPEIEQAQNLLAALAETDEVKSAAASRQRRLKLQTSYGRAMMWSRGFGAEEAKAAFTRAKELAAGVDNAAERFNTYYGLWVGSVIRGELGRARETAETFRRETEDGSWMTEAAVACRTLGNTCLYQGDFPEAQAHLGEARRIYDPERDRDAKFRFSTDTSVSATAYLATTKWMLGEIGRAQELIEEAVVRAGESGHVPTQTHTYASKALFETFRGDAEVARRAAETLLELSQQHGLALYLTSGTLHSAWARARLGDRETGAAELRQALAGYTDQGNKLFVPFYQGLLADFEAEGQETEGALARVDAALALAGETGERWTDAFLHRIRGKILLKLDPANTAPAEGAFLTAIAVAQQQKARSFELRAALSLAKLYQSINRPADAHAVLAPALEGFSPTPEFPEIEEAQTLLASLGETDEVKNVVAARQRRLKLQTSYGQAIAWSKGHGAEETKAAFDRAQELVAGTDDADERFAAYYGQWASSILRSELAFARKTAEMMLREAGNEGQTPEALAAHRALGLTRHYQGDFVAAKAHLEEALCINDRNWDRDTRFRFGMDGGCVAIVYLAQTSWNLGEVERARELIEQAVARAVDSAHVPTLANAYNFKAILEMLRGDTAAALRPAESLIEIGQKHGLKLFLTCGELYVTWAHARLGDRATDATELRRAIAALTDQGNRLHVPFYQGLLAELEAGEEGAEGALSRIDEALALAGETGEHWSDALLHRIRGEILLKHDPANTAPAEEAFLTAIAIAQQQKARSFELRAALALAKLYQPTGRPADAHSVLAPALEGFAPTPEFPEIKEAQALLEALRP